jgi:hypothetical protein
VVVSSLVEKLNNGKFEWEGREAYGKKPVQQGSKISINKNKIFYLWGKKFNG